MNELLPNNVRNVSDPPHAVKETASNIQAIIVPFISSDPCASRQLEHAPEATPYQKKPSQVSNGPHQNGRMIFGFQYWICCCFSICATPVVHAVDDPNACRQAPPFISLPLCLSFCQSLPVTLSYLLLSFSLFSAELLVSFSVSLFIDFSLVLGMIFLLIHSSLSLSLCPSLCFFLFRSWLYAQWSAALFACLLACLPGCLYLPACPSACLSSFVLAVLLSVFVSLSPFSPM